MYHWIIGLEEHPGDLLDIGGVGGALVALHGRVVDLAVELGHPDLARHLKQDRPAFAGAQLVEGATHQLGYALDVVDLGQPLCYVPVVLHGAQDRVL